MSWNYSRRLEAARHYRELRTKAYSDVIASVADSANASRLGSATVQIEALGKATEAKIRILLYGSKSVVDALAKFSAAQGAVGDEPIANQFVALVQAMRADTSVRTDHVADGSIEASIFAPRDKLLR